MVRGFEESTSSRHPSSPLCSSTNDNSTTTNGDAGDFECNICFELAQDPIVTLCGHLFCWPCLYRWLDIHSRSHECPVCKALVQKDKLVPLYGRGKNPTDPRSRSITGMEIPHRPAGQRPETAPPPANNPFAQQGYGGFGPIGGFTPTPNARSGNFGLNSALVGLFPSFFNIQVHGFPNMNMYGPSIHGFHYGYTDTFHGGATSGRRLRQQQADSTLKLLLLVIGLSVLMTLIWG